MRGLAEAENGEPELALGSYIPALRIIGKLFSEEPAKKEYQLFVDNTTAGIGKARIDLNDEEKATKYIEAVRPHIERNLQTSGW
ncbi:MULTISPECIES: hypothetical protein [Methanosarcina]|uniref:TPR-domain containing protein n=3 Tax=Methanosarcina barkeri TaxID=2208 RepID=A0A0E3LNK1_METBA|nr:MULTISPECIES: hypothetical protein [Methanosarcina]AKB54911.1 hypothetical protein MSBRM_1913 [Methanosarcina barkeri MS]AKB57011.1 hypothetical protein MSBR2_0495 [Methanosarcina barkeri 227]AKJ37578.1 hypothetical protein MCM1_0475 [Methanosarcina barkeri CM1]OED10113.1 hypothetical protein A9239_00855 [Methanosarcina sp. A14]